MPVSINLKEQEISQLAIGAYTFRLLRRANGTYRSEPIPDSYKPIPIKQPDVLELVATFESKSNPGTKHTVYRRKSDGSFVCFCTGNARYGHCWHVAKVMNGHKEED